MKTKRNPIQTGLLCAALLPAVGQAEDYTYNINPDKTLTLTSYTNSGGAVTVPNRITDTIDGLPVTSMGTNAFYNYTNVTSVSIGTNVTSIGKYSFYNCASLTSVTIPNSVNHLYQHHAYQCAVLLRPGGRQQRLALLPSVPIPVND